MDLFQTFAEFNVANQFTFRDVESIAAVMEVVLNEKALFRFVTHVLDNG